MRTLNLSQSLASHPEKGLEQKTENHIKINLEGSVKNFFHKNISILWIHNVFVERDKREIYLFFSFISYCFS